MAFALSLSSSNASAAAITALWGQASVFEDQPSMRALNYRPHITFAVYDAPGVTEELATADEIFVTGSAAEVTAIGQIADYHYTVGPITRQLRDDYEALVRRPAKAAAAA